MTEDKTLVERLRTVRPMPWDDDIADGCIKAANLIEAQAAEIERLNETVRRVQAAARTLETTRCEIYQHYVESSKINAAAVSTLDSEREANALLTADIEAQAAEIARLREALAAYTDYCNICHGRGSIIEEDEVTGADLWRDCPGCGEVRAALGGNDGQ